MNQIRNTFLQHLAQTSENPMLFSLEEARGTFIKGTDGKDYYDLISGISVCNVGHSHPEVIKAITEQAKKYMHVMVYGEYLQAPQVRLAKLLVEQLPEKLQSVYFVNSGSEAVEGALKVAKKYTQRSEIIAMKNAYHGSTHAAMSLNGNEEMKNPFRPLLPDVRYIEINNEKLLERITHETACVIIEPIQAEAGCISAERAFLKSLKRKCESKQALLIFDEIQTGMGRTGSFFAFEQLDVKPDILLTSKALGAGLPLGAFISSNEIMQVLSKNPPLNHLTTFGGNPVCCAASKAGIEIILNEKLSEQALEKEKVFRKLLDNDQIIEIRGRGLLLCVQLKNEAKVKKTIQKCFDNQILTDWFLYAPDCIRIAPPLNISMSEIKHICSVLNDAIASSD